MRIFFDNVDFGSSSGPNSFAFKLATAFIAAGHAVTADDPKIQFSFISTNHRLAPTVLRLDGIYFNNEQDWKLLNGPIKKSYDRADAVVVQSIFNKRLVTKYFGMRDSVHVIRNGTCLDAIETISPANINDLSRDRIWFCASSWRPHKRLRDNIRYFYEFAPPDAVLLIAGNDIPTDIDDKRIIKLGNLDWQQLISVMKASSHFLHLAWLDHCPNVVVDARASGCHVVCSSSGGTEEIVGANATTIEEDVWDLNPVRLYHPPLLDFKRARKSLNYDSCLDIAGIADRYLGILNLEN
jgi:glycosyltransferase involved in cell wall biosynthesis